MRNDGQLALGQPFAFAIPHHPSPPWGYLRGAMQLRFSLFQHFTGRSGHDTRHQRIFPPEGGGERGRE